jgi:phosphonate transport system ATP-binding protein
MLQFSKVSRVFDDGTRAIDDIDLHIHKGEFCVLLGPSGAGKSTLMGMVNGMVEPSAGSIAFDQQTIDRRNLKSLQRRVGMVHQQLHLVPRLGVLHNVVAGALPDVPLWRSLLKQFRTAEQRKACRLLAEVELEEKHLYRRASELSGGQQQRVAIARAFMLEPDVVLADEPVASLDPNVSRQVMKLLKQASRRYQSTVLCSLHQVEYAMEFADRIIGLRQGQKVFDGTPDLLSDDILRKIYGDEYGSAVQQPVSQVPVTAPPRPASAKPLEPALEF